MNTEKQTQRYNSDAVRDIVVPTAEEPLEVVIDRKFWHRGKGGPGSKLITSMGNMCCLGFDALACGLKHNDINLITDPSATGFMLPGLVEKCIPENPGQADDTHQRTTSGICDEMMEVNDRESLNEADREKDLTRLALKIHRKFVFVN